MTPSTLLIASPGGHVDELYHLVERLDIAPGDRVWVTAATVQTTRLLARESVEWVPPVASRQGVRALRSAPAALRLLRRHRPDRVISTGAALALPYLLAAAATRAQVHYIESATRLEGPSLTGRILSRVPGIHLHHQAFRQERRRWSPVGNVFDAFAPGPRREPADGTALLLLGSERFPFPRALTIARDSPSSDLEWFVQSGHTPVHADDVRSEQWISPDDLAQVLQDAELVAMHAGVGSILMALRAGKHPVVLPRHARFGEHADDHQLEFAKDLERRGLVSVILPDTAPASVLATARSRSTTVRNPGPLVLEARNS